MNFTLFAILIGSMGIAYSIIGYMASKSIKTVEDYFLAGRNVGIFALAVALIATQFGGGVVLGTSHESYSYGLYGLLYVASICLGFIVLASGVAQKLRSFNAKTTAELFEIRYKSPRLKKIASVISVISLAGILLAQMVASKNLMLSLGVYSNVIFIVFWLFVIGYTMLGGLKAVIHNDIFQLSFIIAVFTALFGYELFSNAPLVGTTLFKSSQLFATPEIFSFGRLFAIIIIPACYTLIEQDIAQSIFAARTKRTAFIGAALAAFFMIIFALVPVYFGMKAQVLGLQVPENANPLMYLFDQTYNSAIVALVMYGIFAAIISTADALLCAISSHCVQDFELVKNKSKNAVRISQLVTLIIGSITLLLAQYQSNIIDIIVGSYSIPVATLFIPLVISYFTDKISVFGAYASVAIGLISFVVLKVFGISGLICPECTMIIISLTAYLIGAVLERLIKHPQATI